MPVKYNSSRSIPILDFVESLDPAALLLIEERADGSYLATIAGFFLLTHHVLAAAGLDREPHWGLGASVELAVRNLITDIVEHRYEYVPWNTCEPKKVGTVPALSLGDHDWTQYKGTVPHAK